MAISIEDTFEGFDEAEVLERLPKFPANVRCVVALRDLELFDSDSAGRTLAIAGKVVESNDASVRPGTVYGVRLNGLNKNSKKKMQFGRIKQLLGGLHGIDPASEQKWLQILGMMIKSPEKRAGYLFTVETGNTQHTEPDKQGVTYEFIPVSFAPPPADHEAMPAAQAKLFA